MSSSQGTSGQKMKQDETQDEKPTSSAKKPWTDPKFSRYGSVKELTRGGSGLMVEGMKGAATMKFP